MKTVKEVSELTGVSVRTLQYYDEIGLLNPTQKTDSGYRMYDDEAILKLQQILFFRELDFKLKDIKRIMKDSKFDKMKAYHQQKQLLEVKVKRMNELIKLLERLEKGEKCMEFKKFDLSDYFEALEEFKISSPEEVVKGFGSIEKFDENVNRMKAKEEQIAKSAIQWYGSIENYTETMKDNLQHFSERLEKIETLKNTDFFERNKELNKKLIADVSKDVTSEEIQNIVKQIIELTEEFNRIINVTLPKNYWKVMIDKYLTDEITIKTIDKINGKGVSQFMGKALQYYWSKALKDKNVH